MEHLNLLLVEDSADDAELIVRALRRGGFAVRHRLVDSPGAMAQALAEETWDLVLSDFRMPGFGGLEALRMLRATGQDVPFILVSGAIGEETAVAAMKAGAHGYVPKDRLDKLCPAVALELREAAARAEAARTKEELRRSEERYRSLFEHLPVPLALLDFSFLRAEGFAPSVDAGLREHLEAHPEALRACAAEVRVLEENQAGQVFRGGDGAPQGLSGMMVEGSWPVFLDLVAALAGGEASFRRECPLGAADGMQRTVSLDLRVVPGCEQSLSRVLVSFVDITERIQMEAALRDLDRLNAKGQLAAYIAHEINNPLAGIKNAFELLEPAIPEAHPHRRYAGMIQREIDRIASIIRTMYGVYRPASQEGVELLLAEVCEDIRSLLAPKCHGRGVEIAITVEPDLRLRCSEGLLRQLLFNLVQNAVETSPRFGVVTLGAGRGEQGTEIRVDDQGPEIPPELEERVFEPGFSTKGGSGMSGMGLGLDTCRSLAESLGGSLGFQSLGPGLGCRFSLRLPG
jgi:signal transduction histidine kinase